MNTRVTIRCGLPALVKAKVKSLSRVRLFATPRAVAYQVRPSMGFSRQEYWSGVPFPSPGDLLDPGVEAQSPALQADALPSGPPGRPMCTGRCAKCHQVLHTHHLTRHTVLGEVCVHGYFVHEKRKAQRWWGTEKYTLLGSLQSS